jgi:hypothetical protein
MKHLHNPFRRDRESELETTQPMPLAEFQRLIIPDGHDWPEWHYAPAKADWEDRNDEGETR